MKKPKGYWMNPENLKKEAFAIIEKEGWTEIPMFKEIINAGLTESALHKMGGRKGLSTITGLPLAKSSRGEANMPRLEKWTGKPSKAFDIEAEAREQGLCYADIQKAKTLAMVGGVQI